MEARQPGDDHVGVDVLRAERDRPAIDFAQGFDNTTYVVVGTVETSATAAPNIQPTTRGASSLQFSVCDAAGTPINLTTAGPYYINLILIGRVTT